MSSGCTDESLMVKIPQLRPRTLPGLHESDGFIFNRVWAAIKRECLMLIAEDVATPEDVDRMWTILTPPGIPPFRVIDRVGLDVVLNIEEHYASVRAGCRKSRGRCSASTSTMASSALRASAASTTTTRAERCLAP